MKKLNYLIKLILTIILIYIFCNSNVLSQDKIKIVTTFTIIKDIAKNITGDMAIVESITKPGVEIHNYQPTPKDIVRVKGANVILWNGLNLEQWFSRFYSHIENIRTVRVSKGIKPISIYGGEYTGKPNPHAWMSIKNAIIYANNILTILVEMDPKNSEFYSNNFRIYSDKLNKIRKEVHKKLEFIDRDKRFLVTSEGAFSYLAKDLNMQEIYIWPMNSDRQGTPQQIRKVIDRVVKENILVIFSESTVSDKPAKQVASETNAIYGGVLYVDSLSKSNGIVPTYIDLIKITTKTIENGFKDALENKFYEKNN